MCCKCNSTWFLVITIMLKVWLTIVAVHLLYLVTERNYKCTVCIKSFGTLDMSGNGLERIICMEVFCSFLNKF